MVANIHNLLVSSKFDEENFLLIQKKDPKAGCPVLILCKESTQERYCSSAYKIMKIYLMGLLASLEFQPMIFQDFYELFRVGFPQVNKATKMAPVMFFSYFWNREIKPIH
jgi:hypothetical protein